MISEELKHFFENQQICLFCICRYLGLDSLNTTTNCSEIILQNDIIIESGHCDFCLNSLSTLEPIIKSLLNKLPHIDFETYLIGVQIQRKLRKLEESYIEQGFTPLALKETVTKFVSTKIRQKLDQRVDYEEPDITILFEIKKRPRYQLQIKSLFIYGRYQKLIRGIPQTKWPCTVCKGKKCDACNFTGQQYPNSVETLVSRHVIDEVKGSGSKFHGAGREDIDALMLGTGRPFVLEIQQPYIRSLDLSQLQAKINQQEMIKVDELQYSTKAMVRYLKSSSPDKGKTYRALIESTEDFTLQDIEQVKDIGQREINLDQRTPIRVAHRRVDKIRKKVVTKIKVLSWQDKLLEVEISAQGGTYIKEFISGDSDRTKPSLASLLSKELVCKELDVTNVAV